MGTRHRGSAEEVLALDSFIKLMRAANTVRARVHRHLAAERLTESQLAILEALYHLGPLSQKALSAKILKSGANVTTVVDNLESRGVVERKRDAKDRRLVNVYLTGDGAALIQRVFPIHAREIVDAMGRLGHAELEALGALCRKLGTGNGT